jgi:outer membrane protein OmpA-like peptidoglycan-associated protein
MLDQPMPRTRSLLALSLPALLAACTTAPPAPGDLHAPAARTSDAAIHADHSAFNALQARIKALNERGQAAPVPGPRVSDYHLSKAQCWLDASFHEYTRNDRSAFPQLALEQARTLVGLMERNVTPLPTDTPLVNDAKRLRTDLWDAAARLKQHRGFACAAQATACAEVALVHAGNEHRQFGWRHAKPYVQQAEDQIGRAQQAAERCLPPAAPAVSAPVAPLPPIRSVERRVDVLFAFDRSDAASIVPDTRKRLDMLADELRTGVLFGSTIRLVGFADRLAHPSDAEHNQRLSERRAQTVQALLLQAGVDPARISVDARGDSEQVQACDQQFERQDELRTCLQANRRVEVRVNASTRQP